MKICAFSEQRALQSAALSQKKNMYNYLQTGISFNFNFTLPLEGSQVEKSQIHIVALIQSPAENYMKKILTNFNSSIISGSLTVGQNAEYWQTLKLHESIFWSLGGRKLKTS